MNHRVNNLDLRHAYEEGYEDGRQQGLRFICDNCYQPRHEHTPNYYRVRTAVRAIFWTITVATISGLSILGIWVLWALL